MISDQGWDIVWQTDPEELENDRHYFQALIRIRLFMSPGSGRMPIIPEVVEAAVVDLISSKIRHISLLLAKKAVQGKIG